MKVFFKLVDKVGWVDVIQIHCNVKFVLNLISVMDAWYTIEFDVNDFVEVG